MRHLRLNLTPVIIPFKNIRTLPFNLFLFSAHSHFLSLVLPKGFESHSYTWGMKEFYERIRFLKDSAYIAIMQSIVKTILLVISVTTISLGQKTGKPSYQLVWTDDFNNPKIDPGKWGFQTGDGCPNSCGWGNNERQYYTDKKENARIENGRLIIEARKEQTGSRSYSSAKLVTKSKADWQHGRIEIRAKLPSGRGTWPAFWMLPTVEGRKMKWPNDGEIDIMEHVGFNQGMIYGTIHTGKYNHMIGTHKTDSLLVGDVEKEFHTYALEWTHDTMSWYVDDQLYNRLERNGDDNEAWPFNQFKYHLVLNLAVGGNWGGKMGIDDSIWPQRIEVDYVKYYELVN